MKVTKCCCFDVYTGAYIIGILGVIRGIFYLTCLWYMFGLDKIDEKLEEFLLEFDDDDVPVHIAYIGYCVFAGTILFTINYIILLIGLVKKEKTLVQIWLLFEGAINSIVALCLAILMCIGLTISFPIFGPVCAFILLCMGLGCYFWCVVYQIYKDVRDGQGQGYAIE